MFFIFLAFMYIISWSGTIRLTFYLQKFVTVFLGNVEIVFLYQIPFSVSCLEDVLTRLEGILQNC